MCNSDYLPPTCASKAASAFEFYSSVACVIDCVPICVQRRLMDSGAHGVCGLRVVVLATEESDPDLDSVIVQLPAMVVSRVRVRVLVKGLATHRHVHVRHSTICLVDLWFCHTVNALSEVIDGGWSSWGSWSSCTKSCDSGVQYRTRSCTNPVQQNGGAVCTGGGIIYQDCNKQGCPGMSLK